MRNIYHIILVAVLCCLSALLPAVADDGADNNIKDYRIRIIFINNFLKYTDWSGDSAPKKTNSANVCIIGDKAFSNYFSNFENAHKSNLAVNVMDSVHGSDIVSCHILFIGKGEEDDIASILSYTKSRQILTMSEAKGFADNGGIVEISLGNSVGLFEGHPSFRVNMRAATSDNLDIDAQALRAASEVIK